MMRKEDEEEFEQFIQKLNQRSVHAAKERPSSEIPPASAEKFFQQAIADDHS